METTPGEISRYTSDGARAYKPRPEMFRLGVDLLGLDPGAVLYVGDSRTSDVAGACAMDIPVAWINRSGRPSDGEPASDAHLGNLGGVFDIIRSTLHSHPAL